MAMAIEQKAWEQVRRAGKAADRCGTRQAWAYCDLASEDYRKLQACVAAGNFEGAQEFLRAVTWFAAAAEREAA